MAHREHDVRQTLEQRVSSHPPALRPSLEPHHLATMSAASSRPYRSHRIPACDRCRRRKARCVVDRIGQSCRLCRTHSVSCVPGGVDFVSEDSLRRAISIPAPRFESSTPVPTGSEMNLTSMTVAPVLRPQSEANASDKCAEMSFEARHQPPNTVLYLTKNPSSGPAFSMIVGPVVAEDVRIVEQYITSDSHQTSARLDAVSDDPAKPVLYRFLPRRREGLPGPSAPGKTQREVLEQILGPFARPLVAV